MVCTLYGGPHGHEHFKCDVPPHAPPKAVRVKTKTGMASVYEYASLEKPGSATYVFEKMVATHTLDLSWLVDFTF